MNYTSESKTRVYYNIPSCKPIEGFTIRDLQHVVDAIDIKDIEQHRGLQVQ